MLHDFPSDFHTAIVKANWWLGPSYHSTQLCQRKTSPASANAWRWLVRIDLDPKDQVSWWVSDRGRWERTHNFTLLRSNEFGQGQRLRIPTRSEDLCDSVRELKNRKPCDLPFVVERIGLVRSCKLACFFFDRLPLEQVLILWRWYTQGPRDNALAVQSELETLNSNIISQGLILENAGSRQTG